MSGQDQDDTNHKNCNEVGVAQSPGNGFYFRQTLGLPKLREKTSEELEREQYRKKAQQGNWSLDDLRNHNSHERGIEIQAPVPVSRHIENNKNDVLENQKAKMLKLGKKLLNKTLLCQPPEDFFVDHLVEELDDLFRSASIKNIWRSFANLSETQQRILNRHYRMGLNFPGDEMFFFLPEEIHLAFRNFQINLVSILAFFHSQLASKEVRDAAKPCVTTIQKGEIEMKSNKSMALSSFLRNSPLADKLKAKGIRSIEQLLQLTSDQLISLFPQKRLNYKSVQSIADKVLKAGYWFVDGEEMTKSLLNYDPKTYKPPAEKTEPDAPAPPADPGLAASQAANLESPPPGQEIAARFSDPAESASDAREEASEAMIALIKQSMAKLRDSFDKSETFLSLKPEIGGKKL